MKKLLFITMLLGALYSTECEEWNAEYGTNYNCDCNESTWQEYYNSDGHNMEGCWLYEANLSGAYLVEANLSEANLTGANLTGAYLVAAELPGANLSGANLSYAWLSGANFTGADLSGANLSGEELEWIILDGANLCNVTASPSGDVCEESSGITDDNGDGYDDSSFDAGYISGTSGGDCAYEDTNEDGYDDVSFDEGFNNGAASIDITSDNDAAYAAGYDAGATSGDMNLDGVFNVTDIVLGVQNILNSE